MDWPEITAQMDGLPIMINNSEGRSLLTLSEGGISVYEPYYETTLAVVSRIEQILKAGSLLPAVNGSDFTELFGSVVIKFSEIGLVLSYPILIFALLTVAKLKGLLLRGVYREVHEKVVTSDSITAETFISEL